jgi:hypothetical protein
MTVPLIRVSTPPHADALRDFLRAVRVDATRTDDPHVLEATVPGSPTPTHERRELQGYLATWNALNPGKHAQLVD